ncbi:MAG: MBL fold metallo-hydrolase [Magnetococcales bacterium]|nr:MBL fold metallo-hydrolase [Magnetococcales bacterium]NGZ27801.1 MBL fold metallo-hydrolase [Magnetococcales bacterium]
MTMQVKFWGVRGSIACPTLRHIRYGGNTSCVEVRVADERVIFDAGTGIRQLGNQLLKKGVKSANLFLSHTHWDHIDGFPFFTPIYQDSFSLVVRAGHLNHLEGGIRSVIDKQMSNPYFPVPIHSLKAQIILEDFDVGTPLTLPGGVVIRSCPLNHPGQATGYRLEHQGRSVCYLTDTEHKPGQPDENILALIQGADLVIYDATYTDAEYLQHVGWGHSTWQEGIRLCRQAKASNLVIFHHDPSHDDDTMAKIEKKARKTWKRAMVARQGMVLSLL